MSAMRSLVGIGLVLAFLLPQGTSTSQSCDQCSRPRVALYDAQMLVPRPTTADSIVAWWTLQWPMSKVRSIIFNTDPTHDCITWFDGAMMNARDLHGDTLHVGVEYFNLPPSGAVVSVAYLLTGSVSGSGGSFTLTVTLETAVSREVVLSRSAGYSYDVTSQQTAAQTLAAEFMPLFQIIRDFEVNKRNSDVTVAIRDIFTTTQDIAVTPKKTKLNVGEFTDVDIEMIDCDGVPLANREISFVGDTAMWIPGSTGGTVEPSTVTTDGSGKATVKFTAGNTTGVGQILAAYPHKKPCGRRSAFLGTAAIVIGQPTKTLWKVHALFSEVVERRIDSTWTSGSGTGSHLVTDISMGAAALDALVENGGADTAGFYFVCYEENGDAFEHAMGWGNWMQDYFKRYYFEGGGLPPSVDIQVKGYNGDLHLGSGYTGFEFHYPNIPTDVAIVAQMGGMAEGTSHSRYTVRSPEYHWEESNSSTPTGASVYTEFNADECTITKSGASYAVSGSRTRVTYSGEQTTKRTVGLDATISLWGSPTGVKQTENGLPTSFCLQQNYPNPFNPNTTINYQVPSHSHITIKVFDVLGREVETLVSGLVEAGYKSVTFGANRISAGVYYYRLQAGNYSETKKLVLLR